LIKRNIIKKYQKIKDLSQNKREGLRISSASLQIKRIWSLRRRYLCPERRKKKLLEKRRKKWEMRIGKKTKNT